MRIIAGSARGKRLNSFSGKGTRPTTDRVREAVFSMLISRLGPLTGLSVLDLYAGTGALALESLSRGASEAVLIESVPKAIALIRDNIAHCGYDANCRLMKEDVQRALKQIKGATFDLIFLDPPYGQGLALTTVKLIKEHRLLSNDGIICVETEKDAPLPCDTLGFDIVVDRIYAQSRIRLLAFAM